MGDLVRPGMWTGHSKGGNTGGGDEPPEGTPLEKRVEKLEATINENQLRLVRIETRLEGIEARMVTHSDLQELKADLFKALNDQTWKFIAAATGMSALFATIAFSLARFLA